MAGPLAGIRILDITSVIMGPYATSLLGDLGAEVIKLETAEGDVGRRLGPSRHAGMSALTLTLHRNKSSVTFDPKGLEGRERLRELIRGCDAVVTNLRPASRERLGLTYQEVRELNNSVVLCTAQAFGSSSTLRDEPAYDDIVQAASGLCDIYRRVDGEPRFAPYVVADKVCGLTMVYSLLAALLHREKTGEGQWVDVPMVDTMLSFNLVEHLAGHTFVPPEAPLGWSRTLVRERRPHRAKDGWICVMPYSDRNWRDFFVLVGQEELMQDKRFATNSARHNHMGELQQLLAFFVSRHSVAEWIELCGRHEIPVQEVLDLDHLEDSAYLTERGFLRRQIHPSEGEYVSVRFPVDFSLTPVAVPRPAPRLGEHNAKIRTGEGR
jgi:crotonobetainyl-CoA:carnitine CoA-transferase CaiB-like acyl-CoA transferase